jgi:hypothetical protein
MPHRVRGDRRHRTLAFLIALAAADDDGAELLALQAEYVAWSDALPESLRDSATAEALQEIIDLDLDSLADIAPPRGFDRD